VATQGGIVNLTSTEFFSNILQQVINISNIKPPKSNAFYVKGKIYKPIYNNSQHKRIIIGWFIIIIFIFYYV
jgi:hypothetical protein